MTRIFCALVLTFIVNESLWAKEAKDIQVEVLTKDTKSWDNTELPDYPSGRPEITIFKITIPPNVALPWHKHPVINAGYLLKGELTVVTEDNQKLYLKAGETIVELVGTWHHGINEGHEPAEIIVFYVGTENTPLSIKK